VVTPGRSRRGGQALVEFALLAPALVLVLLFVVDFGRGLFIYGEMADGAGEMARQAVLQYNSLSNSSPGTGCTSPCTAPGVLPQLRSLAGLGYGSPVYAVSSSATTPPSYGSLGASSCSGSVCQPGRITLGPGAQPNTMYVFVYQFDPSASATSPVRWATCDPCPTSNPVRTGGGKLVVVDLQMRWQPASLAAAGVGPTITLDAQAVSPEEW
jgi:hypothetical protein